MFGLGKRAFHDLVMKNAIVCVKKGWKGQKISVPQNFLIWREIQKQPKIVKKSQWLGAFPIWPLKVENAKNHHMGEEKYGHICKNMKKC